MTSLGGSRRPLRILHVGSGFRPWRKGGLVAYVEDLMAEQVAMGHHVTYFFSGRLYPVPFGPQLRRWRRGAIRMLEVVNSPIFDHGRQPGLELSEPGIERIAAGVIASVRPDVMHVHELAGLPSSVFGLARQRGVPIVMTLQDYFALCPTFKLIDAEGQVCLRREIGVDCVRTTSADPRDPALLYEATIRHIIKDGRLGRYLSPVWQERLLVRMDRWLLSGVRRRAASGRGDESERAAAFQRRRDVNIERLSEADLLIAMSGRVAEIYRQLGVRPDRLRTMQLTLRHIEGLRPSPRTVSDGPLTFATLGGGESEAKGATQLLAAVRSLSDLAPGERFRLVIHGHVDRAFVSEAHAMPGVELAGPYRPAELSARLDEADVGIVPSQWEEAYAYAGMEFLAKGIPIVANAIGGIVDYAREEETAWLNATLKAPELARIMRRLIECPEEVAAMRERVISQRDTLVMPMGRHADAMDLVYRELLS